MINETTKNTDEKENESSRQYMFIELAKSMIRDMTGAKGRALTYCLTTFGCQMNEKTVRGSCRYHGRNRIPEN